MNNKVLFKKYGKYLVLLVPVLFILLINTLNTCQLKTGYRGSSVTFIGDYDSTKTMLSGIGMSLRYNDKDTNYCIIARNYESLNVVQYLGSYSSLDGKTLVINVYDDGKNANKYRDGYVLVFPTKARSDINIELNRLNSNNDKTDVGGNVYDLNE